MNLEIDEDIAYLIGVLQSDGCIYRFYDKKKNREHIRLNLTVAEKSLPMSKKFQEILLKKLNTRVNIRKKLNYDSYIIQTSINKTASLFIEWKKDELDNAISERIELFGAYLAGLIDGDGHVKIKNNHDRIVSQCVIRIAEDRPLLHLQYLLNKFFMCNSHFVFDNRSNCVETCFYISKKNIKPFYKYVYPNMVIPHKINRLDVFLKLNRVRQDSNPRPTGPKPVALSKLSHAPNTNYSYDLI